MKNYIMGTGRNMYNWPHWVVKTDKGIKRVFDLGVLLGMIHADEAQCEVHNGKRWTLCGANKRYVLAITSEKSNA